ncbi:hypothetical protein ACFQ5D_13435 [Paenibacillus farraposensis]|uniref:Uncharacterized protein n=1 Tax=Paenibacillus farraposensis TaxID=2807095 RepID=A0ABW4DHJ6_9BACL|nr:hypothetical protein [Paenibacillus farraposensis]MCC3379500.1 hypothetical protein [Paenibacillus farraposensis]
MSIPKLAKVVFVGKKIMTNKQGPACLSVNSAVNPAHITRAGYVKAV